VPKPAWLWVAPSAARALATRDLGIILRAYRKVNQLSQVRLAEQLGYDPAYISLLERGKRTITDRGSLARIARQLGVPPHILGVTDGDDADFVAMLQFADSVIRLAEITRRSGNAVESVNELWPLIARLEARIANGRPLGGVIRSDEAGDVPVRPGRLNRAVSVEQRPDTLADGVLGLVGAITGGGHDGSSCRTVPATYVVITCMMARDCIRTSVRPGHRAPCGPDRRV
jgi:transcriptional regulator with XRE-family HTH domain